MLTGWQIHPNQKVISSPQWNQPTADDDPNSFHHNIDMDEMERRLINMKKRMRPGTFRIIPRQTDPDSTPVFFHYRALAATQAERQARRRHVCQAKQHQAQQLLPGERTYHEGWLGKAFLYSTLEVYEPQKVFFCPVLKVGSTFFRRIFFALSHGIRISSPYDIPISRALRSRRRHLFNVVNMSRLRQTRAQGGNVGAKGEKMIQELLAHAGKVMFTREPHSKLLSAYVDKLFAPNPYFWRNIGRVIIRTFREKASFKSRRCGHDVTFPEFIKFVIQNEKYQNLSRDIHFVPAYDQCKPCDFDYDIIGKLETFQQDTSLLFAQLGYNLSQSTLDTWTRESEEDAITDSIKSPYSWRKHILPCIDWHEANQRIWRKLQIRGLIDKTQTLSSYDIREFSSSSFTFIRFAKHSWDMFRARGLKKNQRREALSSAYSLVSRQDLELLREYFLLDLDVFGYDSRPPEIFAGQKTWDLFEI